MIRIIPQICLMIFLAILSGNQAFSQRAKMHDSARENKLFSENRYISKGGLGLVYQDLYIVVKSAKHDKNKLLLSEKDSWTGLPAGTPEIVIFYDNKIFPQQALPHQFDISKAVIISFESDKVRFFDFRVMKGGYYKRIWTGE